MGVRVVGTGWWEYTLGDQAGSFVCANEGAARRYKLRRTYRWLTLAWVPVVPAGRIATWIECLSCKAAHGMEVERTPDQGAGTRLTDAETVTRDQSRIAVIPAGVFAVGAFGMGVPVIGLLLGMLAIFFAYGGFFKHGDALLDAGAASPAASPAKPAAATTQPRPRRVSDQAKRVQSAIRSSGGATVDDLQAELGYSEPVVRALLVELHEAGLVAQRPGGVYAQADGAGGQRSPPSEPLTGLAANPVARRVLAAVEKSGVAQAEGIGATIGYPASVVEHLADQLVEAGRLTKDAAGRYRPAA